MCVTLAFLLFFYYFLLTKTTIKKGGTIAKNVYNIEIEKFVLCNYIM